ncbi:ABC-2 type transport system ATP-binding protein [Saccharomonospora amisosensis]|uniref:ABC-2 type transport system ATP-binding protein n=1 Tax=Saccharomonospora amisosensis TaxID=1128677 RepID=A0A7X5UNY2_9PSEU|nr:alpha/beta fold hydrolase [Saccharomonospora amisosensis]NIJ11507.1 ABC-2 type transport system ATP-binding protein [Saccharomonospora amisosensis]
MRRTPRPRGRRLRLLALLAAVVVLGAGAVIWVGDDDEAPSYRTREATIDVAAAPGSEQRVQLDTTLYVPEVTPAPAVLLPHGFGGDKNSVSREAAELAERGFVVLTYSARGFGTSTGRIALNDPDYEVADAVRLVDHLAGLPEVLTEGEGDPLVGVTGASYGGALALLLAGTDERVDAIAPVMTYNDLAQALLPNNATTGDPRAATPAAGAAADDGVFKRAWAGTLFSAGLGAPTAGGPGAEAMEPGDELDNGESGTGGTGGTTDAGVGGQAGGGFGTAGPSGGARQGSPSPPATGEVCGRFTEQVCAAYNDVAVDGRASEPTLALLRRVSPASVTGEITAPTLLVQGENDTLFGLDQADANARQISEAGAPVSVIWYTGGHDGGVPGPQLRATIGDFLQAHLDTARTDETSTPASFRYDVQGSLRASGAPSVRSVEADGYPGLGSGDTQRRPVALDGPEQVAVRPPGAAPAAVSGIPGLNRVVANSSRLSGLFTVDPPGQSATFVSRPLDSQLLVAGSSTVRLRIASAGGPAPAGAAVLFAKLYDVNPDGTRTLPGNAVSAIRVPSLPADGTPVEVTVTLPGVVRPVESGHRLQLVIGTTDQSYATPTTPAAYRLSLAGGARLAVPVVGGNTVTSGWPLPQLLGIAGTLAVASAAVVVAALRRRRSHRPDPALEHTPLVIEGLTKSYPGGLTAVAGLSLRVEPGQVLGLLGPNGAGKTTTLRMLMGLINPTEGEIKVFGHPVRPGAPVLSRIGSFVEGSGFLPHLSGEANLRLYWAATGRPAERAHFGEALEIAGLGDAVHRRVRTYSQGMRQRLAIAQAMLGLPELLVLDEPTNGLDPPQIHQMREVLRRYAATGRTVLVSSHLLAEVEQTCTHVVVMHRGRLVASGAVTDIVAAGGEATFRVDRPEAAAEALRAVGGVSDVDVEGQLVHADLDGLPRSEAVAALVRAGVSVEQAGPRRRLEDAFLQLVGEGEGG